MSAFIVDDMHINAIVTYAIDHRLDYYSADAKTRIAITSDNAEAVGRILMDENVRSVCARYSEVADDEKSAGATYSFKRFPVPLTSIEIIKACDCLAYQSCETDNWEESLAWNIINAIKGSAVHGIGGYEAAPWEITDRSIGQLKHRDLRNAIRLI